jgi:predicted metal-binding protein
LEIPVCNTCNSSKPNSYVLVCTECASKIKESQTTDTQQLKAEISAMISKWKHCCELGIDWYEVELSDYERLQKLSAVCQNVGCN